MQKGDVMTEVVQGEFQFGHLSNVAEIELVYKPMHNYSERPKVRSSKDAFNILVNTWDKGKLNLQEQFKVLLLDTSMACIGVSLVASGGIAACGVDKRLVFATALKAKATKIVLAHNHPSGNLKPSLSDIELTQEFNRAGEIMQISVLDHIIIGNEGYTSLIDEGLCSGWPSPIGDSTTITCP